MSIKAPSGLVSFLYLLITGMSLWLHPVPVKGQNPAGCGTDDSKLSDEFIRALQMPSQARIKDTPLRLCRIAVEIDSESYILSGRDSGRIKRLVLENIAHCSRETEEQANIRLVVTDIRIWEDPLEDPFSGNRRTIIWLNRLGTVPANTTDYDKRMLLYLGSSDDNAGVAQMPGKHSVSPLNSPDVILHELIHNFGSPHTHSCSWPGGPIDHCSRLEGSCHSALESSLVGTVMSYCEERSMQIHPLVRNVIEQHAEHSLPGIDAAPAMVSLTPNSMVYNDDFFAWHPSPGASEYRLEYKEAGSEELHALSVPYNGIRTHYFTTGKEYIVRIKAVNEFGESGWSAPAVWQMTAPPRGAPAITAPVYDSAPVSPGAVIGLAYTAVPDALRYEIEVTSLPDIWFSNPVYQTTTSSTQLSINLPQHNSFRWRVRAVSVEGPGKWSETGFFSVWPGYHNSRFRISAADLNRVPGGFAYLYNTITENPVVRITVSENRDMSSPVVRKIHDYPARFITGSIRDLPAEKKLFLQVEELNSITWKYPQQVVTNFITELTTTKESFPPGVVFAGDLGIPAEADITRLYHTSGNIWYISRYEGLRRIHTRDLSTQTYNLEATNGAWGYNSNSYIATSRDGQLRLLSPSTEGYRYTTVSEDDFSGGLSITPIYSNTYISGFNPDADLFWSNNLLLRRSGSFLDEVVRLPEDLSISDVRIGQNKVYLRVFDGNSGRTRVMTGDLRNLQALETPDPVAHPWSTGNIWQMEVASDGKLWILNTARNGNQQVLTSVDESGYKDYPAPAQHLQGITGFFLSSAGIIYLQVYDTSGHTVIYKLSGTEWIRLDKSLPFIFSGSLVVDEKENYWIGNTFGLVMADNKVTPLPDIIALNKQAFCPGEIVNVSFSVRGTIDPDASLSVHLAAQNGAEAVTIPLEPDGEDGRFRIPDTMAPGAYAVALHITGQPGAGGAPASLSILELPTASLSADKTKILQDIESSEIRVTLTGNAPWHFTSWDGLQVETAQNPFTGHYRAPAASDHEITISNLSDKNCANGQVKNTLIITGLLVLGTESGTPGITVFPNPAAASLRIRLEDDTWNETPFYLITLEGRTVRSVAGGQGILQMPLSGLPAGTYILRTEKGGKAWHWKIIKQ